MPWQLDSIVAEKPVIEYEIMTKHAPNRPELPMTSSSQIIVHEVGNLQDWADEDAHVQFVHNGGGINEVSFHMVNGPSKMVQILYANENAWHASDYYDGIGNRDSLAIENIQIGDWQKTLNHLAWVVAELYRNPAFLKIRPDYGYTDDLNPLLYLERTWQHNFTAPDAKNCPQFIRKYTLWDMLLAAIGKELGKPLPMTYAQPSLPSWWSREAINEPVDRVFDNGIKLFWEHRIYTAIRSAPVTAWVGGPKVRKNLVVGEQVDGRYRFMSKSGVNYVLSRWGSRIRADALSPFISIRARLENDG